MALHPAALLAQRVERREPVLDELVPVVARVRVEAAVHAAGHDDPVPEDMPEPGRQGEPVLVVDRVRVFAEKHGGADPFSTTLPHDKPLFPTCPPLKGEIPTSELAGVGPAAGQDGRAAARRRPATASSIERPAASAYVSPAAKQSPQP